MVNTIEIEETKALAQANVKYTSHESKLGINAIYILQDVMIDNKFKTIMFCKDFKHNKYYLITGTCNYYEWECGMGAEALSNKKYYLVTKDGLATLYRKILKTKRKTPSGRYRYRWIK